MSAEHPAPEMRIGDRERRATDDRLRAALDDGVLTLVEYDERTRECWAARTQRELDALVVDLPSPATPVPAERPTVVDDRPVAATPRKPWHERLGGVVVPLVIAAAAVFVGGQPRDGRRRRRDLRQPHRRAWRRATRRPRWPRCSATPRSSSRPASPSGRPAR